eukprot:4445013-Prymnesium_polylepis.2
MQDGEDNGRHARNRHPDLCDRPPRNTVLALARRRATPSGSVATSDTALCRSGAPPRTCAVHHTLAPPSSAPKRAAPRLQPGLTPMWLGLAAAGSSKPPQPQPEPASLLSRSQTQHPSSAAAGGPSKPRAAVRHHGVVVGREHAQRLL